MMPTRDDHRGRWGGALAYVLHLGRPLKLEKKVRMRGGENERYFRVHDGRPYYYSLQRNEN